jgi:5-methylcytosine-specific restriction endonuclease McrA
MRRISGSERFRFLRLRDEACYKQHGLCYWCNQPMLTDVPDSDPRRMTGDHVIPFHAGGVTRHGNIVAACRKCNTERHPEYNLRREDYVVSHGDDRRRSPFEILKRSEST